MKRMANRTDRRVQRTHQLLAAAFMELIEQKPYDEITIQDITDRANVSRPTFYLHFGDKDELLFAGLQLLYEELLAAHRPITRAGLAQSGQSSGMVDPADFEHVARHAGFYRAIFNNRGLMRVVMMILDYLAGVMQETALKPVLPPGQVPRLPLDLIAHSFAGSEVGLMRFWLEDGLRYTPEQMAQMQFYLSLFGLNWALRLDLTPPDALPADETGQT